MQYALLLCLENDEYLRLICNSFLKDNPSHGYPSLQLKVPAKFKINKPAAFCTYYSEVIIWHPMYPRQFESLSINLKNCILERDVRLESIHDLIHVLEDIVAEGEAE